MENNILELIPQRAPIVMVDKVISANEDAFETSFEITSDNIFVRNKILQEPALIENIAQSAAAGFGFLAKAKNQKEKGLGFIGAISRLECFELPTVGNTIHTHIEVSTQFGAITLIKGKSFCKDKMLICCEMKIVREQ